MRRDKSAHRQLISALVCGGLWFACGCQSSSRSFYMDSNSRSPWFGLNLSLPKPSAKRKTLETIADEAVEEPSIATAELRTPKPIAATLLPSTPVRDLLPAWLGGDSGQTLPPEATPSDRQQIIELQGPREEFR